LAVFLFAAFASFVLSSVRIRPLFPFGWSLRRRLGDYDYDQDFDTW